MDTQIIINGKRISMPINIIHTFNRCDNCTYYGMCYKLPDPTNYKSKDTNFKEFCYRQLGDNTVKIMNGSLPTFESKIPDKGAVEYIFSIILAGTGETLSSVSLNRGLNLDDLGDFNNLIDLICKYNKCYNSSHSNCGKTSDNNLCILKEYFNKKLNQNG